MHRVGFEPTKHDAIELESIPFDHSGICAKNIHDGTRTRNPQFRRLVRYPIAPHGQYISTRFRSLDLLVMGQALFHWAIEIISLGWLEHPTNGFTVHCSANWAIVRKDSAGDWTRITRFKVLSANHYTTKPDNIKESEYCREGLNII